MLNRFLEISEKENTNLNVILYSIVVPYLNDLVLVCIKSVFLSRACAWLTFIRLLISFYELWCRDY